MSYLTTLFHAKSGIPMWILCLQHFSVWTDQISGGQHHTWPVGSRRLCSELCHASEPQPSPLCQVGCELPLWKKNTKRQTALKPRRAGLATALVAGSIRSPHGACPGLPQAPVQRRDLVLCLLVQGHGVQPEERLPLPVATRGLPVLTAASE